METSISGGPMAEPYRSNLRTRGGATIPGSNLSSVHQGSPSFFFTSKRDPCAELPDAQLEALSMEG